MWAVLRLSACLQGTYVFTDAQCESTSGLKIAPAGWNYRHIIGLPEGQGQDHFRQDDIVAV